MGSQSLPHARHIGRQSRPFGDFQPLNLWGQIFSLGSGSGVAAVKSADFTAFSQGLYIGAVSKKELLHLENNAEEKRKFALWIKQSTMERIEREYKVDDCRSKSEFIEKAVLFYLGYLSSKDNEEYFSSVITSTLKAVVDESDNRIGRMIFKLAVELAITMNIIASAEDIDKDSLERLRGECVREVRRLNGSFSFKDAYEWQKE